MVFKIKKAIEVPKEESDVYSSVKIDEDNHDKSSVYHRNSEKILVWLCALGRTCEEDPNTISGPD